MPEPSLRPASSRALRDLKPENILFDEAGRPLVADLGLAKHFRRDVEGGELSLSITLGGGGRGTIGYMPPEQAFGKEEVGPPPTSSRWARSSTSASPAGRSSAATRSTT